MIDSIKRMSLDLHSTTSNESVRVKRSDTGRKIFISLVDGGTPYQITSDCYAVFTAKNAQGNAILHPCTIENNVIVYELKKQATAVPGMLKCEVELYGADDKLITAPKFSILVEDKVYSDGDTEADEGEVSTLAGLIKDAASAISNANTAADNANDVAEELREARDNGEFDGDDYVLTDADKQHIADLAAGLVKIPTGGGFIASDTPPEDTSVLWVDTSDNEGDEPPSGGSVKLDTTLTASGKAADSKAVGDAISKLRNEIPDAYTKSQIDYIMGSYITDINTLVGGDS